MKKAKAFIDNNKGLLAFLLIVLLFFLLRLAIVYICAVSSEKRENEMMHLKMATLMDIVSTGNRKRSMADASVSENLSANVALMTNLLREFVTEDGYTGPRTVREGFVAELKDGRVILPAEYRDLEATVTCDLIEESLLSGMMMTASAEVDVPADGLSGRCYLSFGRIAENVIYVDLFSEQEYTEYLNRFSYSVYESLRSADAAFDGISLLILEKDGGLQVVRQYGTDASFDDLSALGLTEESIREEAPTMTFNGREYLCAYAQLEERQSSGEHLHILQMLPQVSLKDQSVKRALLLDLVMVILFAGTAVYVTAVQRYCGSHELTREEAARYAPKRLRLRMLNVGMLSFLIVFASAMLIESVGQMYTELRYGKDTLSIFSEHMEKANQDQRREIIEEEESWFVYYGEELAALLSEYPELCTSEKLQESCGILGIDYIMLFDSRGRETLCSCDYSGFRLDDEEDGELYDFRRLLLGVPSIVHEPGVYAMTGLERQHIGVKMPVPGKPTQHGALLMALPPDRTTRVFLDFGDSSDDFSVARGTCAFAADSDTGEILYATNSAMIGKTIQECGLPENSLRDGYMDFTAIAGSGYLVITRRDGDCVYYYAVESGTMFEGVVRYAMTVSLLFIIVLTLLLTFLLSGNNERAIKESAELRAQIEAAKGEEGGKKKPGLLRKLLDAIRWEDLLPVEKLRLVLRAGILVLIVCTMNVLHDKPLPNESYDTMFGFLMHGDWMRGFNLFCICSILQVIAVAYPINLLNSLVLGMSGKALTGQGVTVCRLVCSCVKYVTAFAVIYFGLEYLGFSTGTILASLGVVSLALSLGAQDLIKDILSGLALVFDECFCVGDIVEIGGTCGTVLEVGMRSTKLRVSGDNILFVNNHEITDVLNMSKELTEIGLGFKVPASESLLKLEELLNRELPKIGKKNRKIVKGPYLLGVAGLGGSDYGLADRLISLEIGAVIDQKDASSVKYFLKREIFLLFEREGIELL